MSKIRKLRQYSFILLYSIVFGLIVGELAVRGMGLSKTWTTKNEAERHAVLVEKYFNHGPLGHRFVPGSEFISILDIPYSINADGFRDKEFIKDSNRTLIAFFGASIIEGLGVNVEKRATNIVLDELRGKGFENVEIYNFGIGASSTYDEIRILKEHGYRYQPDYAVLQVGFNDLAANVNRNKTDSLETEETEDPSPPFLKGMLQSHSALYLYLAEAYNAKLLRDGDINSTLNKVLNSEPSDWHVLFDALEQFVSACELRSIEPVIMYIPFEVEVLAKSDSVGHRTNTIIRKYCTKRLSAFC